MGYPPQPPYGGQQPPQPPYGQPQQGYPQGPPQGYPAAPQPYGQQPFAGGGSDAEFAQLYGQANVGAGLLYDEGDRDAIVTEASYGLTRAGDKGQWVLGVRISSGPNAGARLLRGYLTINPTTKDGLPNPDGMGLLMNELHALGVPLPPPLGAPGEKGFWELGMSREQVAQGMVGRPVGIHISIDRNGDAPRNRIRFTPPRPGAPTQLPAVPGQQPQAPAMGGYQPGPVAQGYAPPGPPQGYPQQPAQPVGGPPQGYPQGPGQPPAAPPQQYAPPQPPGAVPPQQWANPAGQPVPGPQQAPGPIAAMPQQFAERGQALGQAAQQMMPQQADPGQPGIGQFQPPAAPPQQAPPGQAPPLPWQSNGAPQAPQAQQAPPPQGQAPPPPPWAGGQPAQ